MGYVGSMVVSLGSTRYDRFQMLILMRFSSQIKFTETRIYGKLECNGNRWKSIGKVSNSLQFMPASNRVLISTQSRR